jgi:hypothetical protein
MLARRDPPAAAEAKPDPRQLNTGVLCDGLRAIDIDVDNPTLCRAIQNKAMTMFGETIIRYRDNSPRILMVYRAASGAPPKAHVASELGKVEVLGHGQQFVAYGVHSSGSPLRWMPEAPHEATLQGLPALTEAQVREFLEACAVTLGAKAPGKRSETPTATSGKGLRADSLQVITALHAIPNDGPTDWESWNRIGMAIWAATGGSSSGLLAWHAWSEQHPSYDAAATQDRWDHYFQSPPTHIGAGTLFYMARAARGTPGEDPSEMQTPAPYDEVYEAPPAAKKPVISSEIGSDKSLPYTLLSEVQPKLDASDFVEGVLTDGSMSVVYGESNSGKTFFVSDLAIRVAAGMGWRDKEVEQGAVLYLALEGGFGIVNRIAAFREVHGLDTQEVPFAFVTVGINLLDPEQDAKPVIETVKKIKEQFKEIPLRLIVVDTLSRAMAGGNENAPEDMTRLVATGDQIREHTGAHLLWIHHSGKDQAKGARGHSSLRAATDTEIEISAEGQQRMARVTKQRDLECSGEFTFTLKVIELGENKRGKPVTSCVVEHDDGQAPGGASVHRRQPKGHAKRAFEVLCDLISSSGQQHASTPGGVLSVPDKWWRERFYERAMPGAEAEAKKKAFQRVSSELLNGHFVAFDRGRVWLPGRDPGNVS